MNQRLLDALDLLKMLEVVFEQRQSIENASLTNDAFSGTPPFPWSGIRLTLKQSRDLLTEIVENSPVQTQENKSLSPRINRPHSEGNAPSSFSDTRQFDRTFQSQNPTKAMADVRPGLNDINSLDLSGDLEPTLKNDLPKVENTKSDAGKGDGLKLETTRSERSFRGTFNRIQLTQEPVIIKEVELPSS